MEEHSNEKEFAPGRDASHYSLTIEEAVLLFEEAGLPRSKRSIQKACKRGHLDCTLGETNTGQRYFITGDSVHRRIEELKQIESRESRDDSRTDADRRGEARTDANRRDTSQPRAEEEISGSESVGFRERIRTLELENVNLKIDNKGKELFINRMVEERQELLTQVREGWQEAMRLSSSVGRLEERLALSAPPTDANQSELKSNKAPFASGKESGDSSDGGEADSEVFDQTGREEEPARLEGNFQSFPNEDSSNSNYHNYPQRYDA